MVYWANLSCLDRLVARGAMKTCVAIQSVLLCAPTVAASEQDYSNINHKR